MAQYKNPDKYVGIFPIFTNPNNWKVADQRTAANKFMADIGERNYPGFKGFVQKFGSKFGGAFSFIIAVIGTLLLTPVAAGVLAVASKFAGDKGGKLISDSLVKFAQENTPEELKNKVGLPIYMDEVWFRDAARRFGMSIGSRDWARHFILERLWQNRGAYFGISSVSDEEASKNLMILTLAKIVVVIPEDDPRMAQINQKYDLSNQWRQNNFKAFDAIWLEPGIEDFLQSWIDWKDKPGAASYYDPASDEDRKQLKALAVLIASFNLTFNQAEAEAELARLKAEYDKLNEQKNQQNQMQMASLTKAGLFITIGVGIYKLFRG